MIARAAFVLAVVFAASAQAQQYRWVDEKGRVHYTDTPPPPTARDVRRREGRTAAPAQAAEPFELQRAMQSFPVTLYTAPECQEPCQRARDLLNARGVPFREVQVWDPPSVEALKALAGAAEVPTLVVGRSVQRGFLAEAYESLLDSALYPPAGRLPVRKQAAPPPPEGYVPPEARKPVARAVPEEQAEAPAATGPYSPGARRTR